MRPATLYRRSLAYHWRTHVGVVLGVAVGSAVLTGALIVGDSMRESLRRAALDRLGRVDLAIVSGRYFREALATEMAGNDANPLLKIETCPAIMLRGGSRHAETQARAGGISILGVDERFWNLASDSTVSPPRLAGRSVAINERLAIELGAAVGDDILLHVGKPGDVSTETLLGRRDDTTASLRLTVASIVPAKGLGAFSLNPGQRVPRNAFVPLEVIQRSLRQADRANALFVAADAEASSGPDHVSRAVRDRLQRSVKLNDYGLHLRTDISRGYVALESDTLLIPPPVEASVFEQLPDGELNATRVLTYLANSIELETTGRAIPYSVVTALDPTGPLGRLMKLKDGQFLSELSSGELLLNDWAAGDLSPRPGDTITLTYYITGAFGQLETKRESFTLGGVAPMDGPASDPGFTPDYEGVTDTQDLGDWNAPFPMDLNLIRERDEVYWDQHRGTPKAFVTLADGQRLWAHDGDRLGRLTSIRFYPAETNAGVAEAATQLERRLLAQLEPAPMGLAFQPVREQMTEASKGSTDFGGLFIGFSFFLIASAAMLVALLFRLSVEQRTSQIGLLLAVGITPAVVRRVTLTEGAILAVIGCACGLAASLGYAWLMLAGLRTWWSDAVNTPFLALHVSGPTIVIGAAAGLLLAVGSMAWSLRGLFQRSARSLLAGIDTGTEESRRTGRRFFSRWVFRTSLILAGATAAAPLLIESVSRSVCFFLSGAAMLIAGLAFFAARLGGEPHRPIDRPGPSALWRLGVRNARRHAGRSQLTAGLIAAATFLIAALEAFHLTAPADALGKATPTGGFALYAESAAPLVYDFNSSTGREKLGILPDMEDAFRGSTIIPFRLRPGDESSCLNLYKPTAPRMLGAGPAAIERGGFQFSRTLAESPDETANPWRLLHRSFDDGAIPVIGDESAVLWQLHLGLGKDLTITDEAGREVTLRFVALLKGSVLQDELIVSEEQFTSLFPSIGGHAFFLIDAPKDAAAELEATLERELAPFGFDAGLTRTRLADYLAVQNTYLSTFQTLGGFGLLLGSVGLAAVLLRNVWERRSELALLQAVGYTRLAVGWTVLAENVVLLLIGLTTGLVAAGVAVAPHLVDRASTLPWASIGVTLAAVFATGLVTGGLAALTALRAPLIPALRAE